MRVKDITHFARQYALSVLGLNKTALIHLFQRTEGNFDCFASAPKAVVINWPVYGARIVCNQLKPLIPKMYPQF